MMAVDRRHKIVLAAIDRYHSLKNYLSIGLSREYAESVLANGADADNLLRECGIAEYNLDGNEFEKFAQAIELASSYLSYAIDVEIEFNP
jgi:hypothetical protein